MPATTTRPTVTRAPLPARCEASWLALPPKPGAEGTADINGEVYTVASILDKGRRVGVRFVSPRGDVRDVDLTEKAPTCDCPDWETRRKHTDGKCRHVLAVVQLDQHARELRLERANWSEAT
jgi:hypothetical protein